MAGGVFLAAGLAMARCAEGPGIDHHQPLGTDGGGQPDAGPVADGDAGDGDAGDGADAGPADGSDPFANLPPMRPECANGQQADESCWEEWLKEVGRTDFQPVERGALGAGPWPAAELLTLGAAEGLDERPVGVSVDTGQNQYAVSRDSLFVRRAGAARFEKYPRGTAGLRDYPFLSVAGAGPGVVWVGHEGVSGIDPETDPSDIRKSGDAERVVLVPGGIEPHALDTHNSNTPISGKFDHSRSIYEIRIPRRGAAAGEVYLGTEHGLVRYQGDKYADHVHIATVVNGSQRFGRTGGIFVDDAGTAWYGNDFQFGGRKWAPRLYEWYFHSPWRFPTRAFGGEGERNLYRGIGVDSQGNVWAGAQTRGLAHLVVSPSGRSAAVERVSVPDSGINDLAVDVDDSVWLATDSGLWRYTPADRGWKQLFGGSVGDLHLDDTVTPRALYAASSGGVRVYRGP